MKGEAHTLSRSDECWVVHPAFFSPGDSTARRIRSKAVAGSNGTAKGTAKGSKSVGGRSLDGSHNDLPEPITDGGWRAINTDAQIEAIAKNANLSKDEATKSYNAIFDFTAHVGYVRDVERGKPPDNLSPEKLAAIKEKIRAINQYIAKAPAYKGEIYRGMAFKTAEDRATFLKSLGSKSLNAMSSFSSDLRQAKAYADDTFSPFGVVLKVVNNKSGVSIKNVSRHSREDEVLVPKGTNYKIVKVVSRNSQMLDVEVKEV